MILHDAKINMGHHPALFAGEFIFKMNIPRLRMFRDDEIELQSFLDERRLTSRFALLKYVLLYLPF